MASVVVAEVSYSTTTTPKTATFPTAEAGDKILVILGGNKTGSANAPTAAAVTHTAGSVVWTDPADPTLENLSGTSTSCWFSSAYGVVSGTGSVTVSVDRTQPATVQAWGFTAWLLKGYGQMESFAATVDSASEVQSLTVGAGSFVGYGQFDWDTVAPTTYLPADAVEVEKAATAAYSFVSAYWENQPAGTRNYGTDGSSSGSLATVAISVSLPSGPSLGFLSLGNGVLDIGNGFLLL